MDFGSNSELEEDEEEDARLMIKLKSSLLRLAIFFFKDTIVVGFLGGVLPCLLVLRGGRSWERVL